MGRKTFRQIKKLAIGIKVVLIINSCCNERQSKWVLAISRYVPLSRQRSFNRQNRPKKLTINRQWWWSLQRMVLGATENAKIHSGMTCLFCIQLDITE